MSTRPALFAVLLLVPALACGDAEEPTQTEPAADLGNPELDGTWFVLYEDDPKPYLDVTFAGNAGAVASASASLTGPSGVTSLPLTWNAEDSEWQADCSELGPLAPGTWWVSAVRAVDGDGVSHKWKAPSQWLPYARTGVMPGFFSVPDPSARRVRIETAQVAGRQAADPVLYVYRGGELHKWAAANDDRVTTSPYPAVEVTAAKGEPLLIRVEGEADDVGDYALRVRLAPDRQDRPLVLPEGSEASNLDPEPDGPTTPVALQAGGWIVGTLAGPQGDVDWLLVTSP